MDLITLRKIIFSLFLENTYFFLADAGKLCSDHSSTVIRKDQCRESLATIKKTYSDAVDGIDFNHSWPGRPKGCFLHLKNANLHWNPDSTGRSNIENRQVCEIKYRKGINKFE